MKFKIHLAILWSLILISFSSAQQIETEKRLINDTVHIDFTNPTHAPIEFRFKLKDSFINDFIVQKSVEIPPKATVASVISYPSFYSIDTTKTIYDFMEIKGNYGSPNTVIADKDHHYILPYPKGKRYNILQGFYGKFSHDLDHSRHAIDFELQIGDTITAARSGVVIFTKRDSKEHGKDRSFMNKANKIIIMHSDGTFGHYVHLDFNQVFVEEGMGIEAGQPIGLSGMTGFTTKPHLHFVVMRERGQSIPIKFENVKNDVPIQGKKYKRN